MKKILITILSTLLVLGVAYFAYTYFVTKKPSDSMEPVACTMDARVCPDGSSVGRTGPNCEFAACPVVSAASTTKTFFDKNLGLEFSYVDNFYIENELAKYIHPVEWPPQADVRYAPFSCKATGAVISVDGKTEMRTIDGNKYCVTTASEGAAGSTYTTYTYKRQFGNKTVVMSFVTRAPQCANYDEPEMKACELEKTNFSVDNTIDKIFSSVNFTN